MHRELADRKVAGDKAYVDLKAQEQTRLNDIKSEYEKAKQVQRDHIADKEAEVAGMLAFVI